MKTITGFLFMAITMAACSDNNATPGNTKKAGNQRLQGDNIVSFKVNGIPVKTSGWNISRFIFKKTGEVHLAISSNMHEDTRTIKANIDGVRPGSYNFSDNIAATYAHYYPDFNKDIFDNYGFVSGAFVIAELDTTQHLVNASFAGTVKNKKGQSFEITEGRIENGKLKTGMEAF